MTPIALILINLGASLSGFLCGGLLALWSTKKRVKELDKRFKKWKREMTEFDDMFREYIRLKHECTKIQEMISQKATAANLIH